MFGFIAKMFVGLLIGMRSTSNHTKCLSLSICKCITQPTPINLHRNEYSELHFYSFAVILDRCVGSCITLNNLSNQVCVPNKREDLNISVLNMITGKSESKLCIYIYIYTYIYICICIDR